LFKEESFTPPQPDEPAKEMPLWLKLTILFIIIIVALLIFLTFYLCCRNKKKKDVRVAMAPIGL